MYPEVWTVSHWRQCGAFRALLVPNQTYKLTTQTYNTYLQHNAESDRHVIEVTQTMAIGKVMVAVNFIRSIIRPQDYDSTKNKLGKVCRQ